MYLVLLFHIFYTQTHTHTHAEERKHIHTQIYASVEAYIYVCVYEIAYHLLNNIGKYNTKDLCLNNKLP